MKEYQKAAILLSLLGPQRTRLLWPHLGDHETKKLIEAMNQIRSVSVSQAKSVLEDFYNQLSEEKEYIFAPILSHSSQLKDQLKELIGSERIKGLWGEGGPHNQQATLDALEMVDDQSLAQFLSLEHPQTITLILAHLPPQRKLAVLSHFPLESKGEILLRFGHLSEVNPANLEQLNQLLKDEFSQKVTFIQERKGGVKEIIEILHLLDTKAQQKMLESLQEKDPALVEKLKQQMVTFDDLIYADESGLRFLIKAIPQTNWTLSFKLAPTELQAKVLKNMSQRASQILIEDVQNLGPVKRSTIEKAQKEILEKMQELMAQGKLTLQRNGSDDPLV